MEKTKKMLEKRLNDVQKSFKKYYSINFLDLSHYDLVFDTTNLIIQQVIDEILNKINKEQK